MLKYLLFFSIFLTSTMASSLSTAQKKGIYFRTRLIEANKLFSQANKLSLSDPAKSTAQYREALLRYDALLEEDESSHLHYNIGNTQFRLGDNGRAIYHYQKALALDPLNEDLQHNLNYVRTLVVDDYKLSPIDKILGAIVIWSKLPIGFQIFMVALSLAIFFVIQGRQLYKFCEQTKKYSFIALAVALIFILGASVRLAKLSEKHDGVIVAKQVTARQGDGLIYEPAFETKLHNGSEFVLLEDRGEWLHIELADESRAWVQRNKVALW